MDYPSTANDSIDRDATDECTTSIQKRIPLDSSRPRRRDGCTKTTRKDSQRLSAAEDHTRNAPRRHANALRNTERQGTTCERTVDATGYLRFQKTKTTRRMHHDETQHAPRLRKTRNHMCCKCPRRRKRITDVFQKTRTTRRSPPDDTPPCYATSKNEEPQANALRRRTSIPTFPTVDDHQRNAPRLIRILNVT